MHYTESKIGRVFVLRLHDGDHMPDILEAFAEQKQVSSAICFLVGGIKDKARVVVGPKNGEVLPIEPVITLLSGVHEICGIGTIFLNDERKPKLHMHASFGRGEKVITGCVRNGMDVWLIGEVVVLELENVAAQRTMDKETGFELLEIK